MPEASIDAIVCDPPYGLAFMGKDFDKLGKGAAQREWHKQWAVEALRILKPGGHAACFGGTRTSHHLASALEEVGFEIRDSISVHGWTVAHLDWTYGTGFPKSLNVEKKTGRPEHRGLGTALKPAHEPIILARKPLIGTVAKNVLRYGTGALNIDACRIGTGGEVLSCSKADPYHAKDGTQRTWNPTSTRGVEREQHTLGRWPANLILVHHPDCRSGAVKQVKGHKGYPNGPGGKSAVYEYAQSGHSASFQTAPVEGYADEDGNETVADWNCVPGCPVAEMDAQSGASKSSNSVRRNSRETEKNTMAGKMHRPEGFDTGGYVDKGGASRFFYCAKASKAEREAGCEGLGPQQQDPSRHVGQPSMNNGDGNPYNRGVAPRRNNHPTVKPVSVMKWIVDLLVGGRSDAVVLDPFAGSGTTGIAALQSGVRALLIESDPHYCDIARARMDYAMEQRAKAQGE
jgi:site-specific DNA-methyltransferase (adenine-specific)